MQKPKFPTLDKFVHRCINNSKESVNVNKSEAKSIANEYTHLLYHLSALQDYIISLQKQNAEPIEVEIDSGNF
tara:strand:+ start:372 stop:590 length:219 start_codon:yes stop_codon:yes gene_type:complete